MMLLARIPCANTRLPYLIKYERMPFNFEGGNFSMRLDRYNMAGVMALESDYYELSDDSMATPTINTDALVGGAGCPAGGPSRCR